MGRSTTAEERNKTVAALRTSGLSQEEFARKHKINVGTLRSWICRPGKLASIIREKDEVRFAEVQPGTPLRRTGEVLRIAGVLDLEMETLPPVEYVADLVLALC